jgi:predicted Rossmann fold nucleotide-binding protein DprA/Smf involved in DNA uptake
MDPLDARSAEILEDIDRDAPANETREDRTRRRITALLEHATAWGLASDLERSVAAVDLALSEDPNSALAQKLIHRNRETIMSAFQGFLGDLQRTPMLARPLHELGSAPISPRAAFLLSRVDGTLSLDEILDVSGMPHLEACRYLCQLFLRGILR